MKAARAGLRAVLARKGETAAMAAVVILVMFAYGFTSLAIENLEGHIYLQMRESLGDAAYLVPEAQAGKAEATARRVGGVASTSTRTLYTATLLYHGSTLMVPIAALDELDELAPASALDQGRPPSKEGEAALYLVATAGGRLGPLARLAPGDSVEVRVYTSGGPALLRLRVTGIYKGYSWIAGQPYALLLGEVPESMRGSGLALVAATLEPGLDVASKAGEIRDALEREGVRVYGSIVNTPETNPILAQVRAGASFLSVPASLFLALAAVLPAAVGVVGVFRDLRTAAALRAMGAGPWVLAAYYTLPWLARALLGVAASTLLVAAFADDLYYHMMAGGGEPARALAERYGFHLDPRPLARAALAVAALSLLGALAPLAAALRVNLAAALRLGGAPLTRPPPRRPSVGPLWARAALRELAGRWWKLAGMILALSIAWGVAAAMDSSRSGLEASASLAEERLGSVVLLSVAATTPSPPSPACAEAYRLASNLSSRVLALYGEDSANTLRGETVSVRFYAPIRGDASLVFPLAQGRYPRSPGEAVLSVQMARLLGARLGGEVELRAPSGESVTLRIVGLADTPLNRGFYVLASPGAGGLFSSEPGASGCTLALEAPEGAARLLQERLLATGWLTPLRVETGGDIAAGLRNVASVLLAVQATLSAIAGLAAGAALAGLALADVASRSREYAALLALGAPSRALLASQLVQLAASTLLASPLALAWARLAAGVVAVRVAPVVGYYPPSLEPSLLAGASAAAGLSAAYVSLAAVVAAYLRRLDVVGLLRE